MAPYTDISTRALIITLKSPIVGLFLAEIFAITRISISTIVSIAGQSNVGLTQISGLYKGLPNHATT